jgi:imidazolonepropionase-like amidohydrolase
MLKNLKHQSTAKQTLIVEFTKRICSTSALILVPVLASLLPAPVQAESLLIRNAHIISGDNPKASTPKNILIDNGKIKAIGKNLGRADKEVDARGQFLIPGLIDTHVHLDGVPGYAGADPADAAMLKEAREQIPRSYSYFGFTTVLDLTGDPDFIEKWNTQALAPRAYFCAPVIIPNGYPASWMDKDAQFQVRATSFMLFDPQQPNIYPANFLPQDHTPEAVVALAKKYGASCIKVFYETGFGPKKNLPVPTVALIQKVVEQAKHFGLPVYLHGNSQAAYEFALKAGVNTLVHGLWHETKTGDALEDQRKVDALAGELVKAGIAIQPTMQVLYGEQETLNPDFFNDPQVQHAIPYKMGMWYQSKAGQWMKNILSADFEPATKTPAELYQAVKVAYQRPLGAVRSMTKQLNQRGARILFGSDTPSGPFYTQFPGINGRWEMDRWLETGISLPQLFTAMTINNARALGLEKSIGSVQVGMQADLLLLAENPLLKVSAYDGISQVILKGVAHQRAVFSAKENTTRP